MFKMLKLFIAAWIIFAFVAVVNDGGSKLRAMDRDAQRVVSKTINIAADKADSLKEQADAAKEKVKSLSGANKEVAQTEDPAPAGKKSRIR